MKSKWRKQNLCISFSGGRTSAYMTWWLLNVWEDRDKWNIIVVFANTGKEQEGTLQFVQRCAVEWNIDIVWVEAIPVESKAGKWWRVIHKQVDFDTAARKGEPFELMISKLGIPSTNSPFCSPQLKRQPIRSYIKSLGWGRKYYVAVGFRVDEVDRINPGYKRQRLIYPLVQFNPIDKKTILAWWGEQPFNLMIPPDLGNCDNCWKKNTNLLVRNAINYPDSFDWWQDMTDKYGHFMPRKQKKLKPPFNFYRSNLSPKDIFKLARLDQAQLDLFSQNEKVSGCSESCEPF